MTTAVAVALLAGWACACGGSRSGGSVEVAAADCASCHELEAAAFEHASSHQILFDCDFCHAELARKPGPGHRDVPECQRCHSEAGHPPAYDPGEADHVADADGGAADNGGDGADPASSCATCHNPHGSSNLFLIREQIRRPEGTSVPMIFQDLSGRADWSYAELAASEGGRNAREPGEGLCEVCHTHTRFYNRYGSGEQHAQSRCVRCHDHARSFVPREAQPAQTRP